MSKDVAEKRLEWHKDVFVDIFNNVLFEGAEVLKEENLIHMPTQSYVRGADGKVHENNRDIRKVDKEQNEYRLVCGLENQTHKIKHPEEFLDALSEVASDVQYKELKKILTEEQKEELTMCIIADELVGQGRMEGRQAGLLEGRQAGLLEGRQMFVLYQENQARRLKAKGISLEDAKEILLDFDVKRLADIYAGNV